MSDIPDNNDSVNDDVIKESADGGNLDESGGIENLNLKESDETDKKSAEESILASDGIEREEIHFMNGSAEVDGGSDIIDDVDEDEDDESDENVRIDENIYGEVYINDGNIKNTDLSGGDNFSMLPVVANRIKRNAYSSRVKIDRKKPGKVSYLPIHIFAFAIPFMLMLIAYATIKIYPFGNQQIMIIDSWHQYFPFLQELQYKLTHLKSLMYDWNTGAGTNFLTLMAYYASTPLYLLSVLFPKDSLREFMMLTTVVKISCSGLFFSIYLRGIYNHDFRKVNKSGKLVTSADPKEDRKRCSLNIGLAIIGFSLLYAVSAYAVGYYWCIMFLDGMALLPLIILGLERFIDSGKFKLYIIALGVAIIADFYVSIFICIFIAVYFIVLYFMKVKKPSLYGFVIQGLKTFGASLIGVGLSMFIILPTFLWFGNTGNSGSKFTGAIDTYNNLIDIINHLLPATTPAIRAGLPNIACGLICVIFGALYFINSKIRVRDKLLVGGFLLFMLFSFNINILNFIWHGGHYPNEIPYRQAFVFTFVLVTAAFKSFVAFKGEGIKIKSVWVLGVCMLGYLILMEQLYGKTSDQFNFRIFYISMAFLIVYMAILLLYKNKKFSANYLATILIFAMMFEGGMSAVKGAETSGTSGPRDVYPPSADTVRQTVGDIYAQDPNKFFRLEMSRWYSTNDPALYGYRGISQFSSEANGRFARTLEVLGLAANVGSNRYLYSSATPVFNMLLSLKYLMSRDEASGYPVSSVVFDEFLHNDKTTALTDANGDPMLDENGEQMTDTSEPVTAYINKYWLPLGFMMSENVNNVDVNEENTFMLQNDLMKKAAGITGNVFNSITSPVTDNINMDEYPGQYGIYSYRSIDKTQQATVTHYYTSDVTQEVYMYVKAGRGKNATVTVNGRSSDYEITRGITIDCGQVTAGQDIKVTFTMDPADSGTYYIFTAGFDENVFKQGYDILNSSTLNVTSFDDTDIKGDITANEDGLLFTSIPYDKGWHVKIDGKEVQTNPKSAAEQNNPTVDKAQKQQQADERQITKITDGFVVVPMTSGTHKVELYYVTYGFIPGLLITILCILLIIAWEMYDRFYKKNKASKKAINKGVAE
ncbi:MAG: YfhO family protein [Oscillospiraceae bacterium]|nr:YfhO family protein [Oscillospiraceae bacterium]